MLVEVTLPCKSLISFTIARALPLVDAWIYTWVNGDSIFRKVIYDRSPDCHTLKEFSLALCPPTLTHRLLSPIDTSSLACFVSSQIHRKIPRFLIIPIVSLIRIMTDCDSFVTNLIRAWTFRQYSSMRDEARLFSQWTRYSDEQNWTYAWNFNINNVPLNIFSILIKYINEARLNEQDTSDEQN